VLTKAVKFHKCATVLIAMYSMQQSDSLCIQNDVYFFIRLTFWESLSN